MFLAVEKNHSPPTSPKVPLIVFLYPIYLASFILVVLLFLFVAGVSPYQCADMGCFITKANQCSAANYEANTSIGAINYSVKSLADNGCVLTKKIASLNQNENALVKNILGNKQMNCVYPKGKFAL